MDTAHSNPIGTRLTELNTKAYYLLVALSFVYRTNPTLSLKLAITLTALVAVLPVQDCLKSERALDMARWVKVVLLTFAMAFALWWVWSAVTVPAAAAQKPAPPQPTSEMPWWVEHFAVPAAFTVLGAAIGFILGRINQQLDARKSKNNFLRAIGVELRGLQEHLKLTKHVADEALAELKKGKSEVVNFTDSYELTIFTTQLGKLSDVSDERILNAIEIYSDIGAAQSLRNSLSSEGMKIVQLDSGDASRQTRVEYYFTGLKHLSDIISMVQGKIEKLLPELSA
jgi:hypothetical protein